MLPSNIILVKESEVIELLAGAEEKYKAVSFSTESVPRKWFVFYNFLFYILFSFLLWV